MNYIEKYEYWLSSNVTDEETKKELESIKNSDDEIKERFYNDLEFGTAGLRGIIGAGSGRINIYTVRKATQGLASYICESGEDAKKRGVAISYDSRKYSPEFAMETARVLAANGVKAYVFDKLHPVPVLSFAVRDLGCYAGVMITASHNPAKYNGYKVYGEDGAQLNVENSNKVIGFINKMDIFKDVKIIDETAAREKGLIVTVGDELRARYEDSVLKCRKNPEVEKREAKELKIVYTPFHGSGLVPVCEILEKAGYENVYVVKEQAEPDPAFSTVKSPNPEDKEGFYLAVEIGEKLGADVILGTDPDADRIGVVVKNKNGEYEVLTGNQTGLLLTEYILSSADKKGEIGENDYIIKTIVTTGLTNKIAENYGVKLYDVYTGFKFIAEVIKNNEEAGKGKFHYGFEESYGSLPGTYARDKDAVAAVLLICELAAVLKGKGLTLSDALTDIYKKYGYSVERTVSVVMEGLDGMEKMAELMKKVENNPIKKIGDTDILAFRNYNKDVRYDFKTGKEEPIGFKPSNVLYFELSGGGFFILRPSGTEPKIKFYYSVPCSSIEEGNEKIDKLDSEVKKMIL
ncbi:MAG: phospho-sugar mutase [Clostridia bacterium]|nr:phospho-sugar mutase [Clostridia bacterium]